MAREISESPQEKPESRTVDKNVADTNSYMREKLGKSREEPETPERPEGNRWHSREDHAKKVGKILGEQSGPVEPKVLKEKSEDNDSNKGGGSLPPGGDQGKRGGDSNSQRRSMAQLPVEKKSAEPTEQKPREEPQGRDQTPTTAQASRMDQRGLPQHQDRPRTPPR
ncbi:MAG: hypothetical protein ACRDTG_09775 [Pseudonocardiaceae bacterium]